MNDTNPYAAPEPVEEDFPGYNLRKIARIYNRLGVVLNWCVQMFAIWIAAVVGICAIELANHYGLHFYGLYFSAVMDAFRSAFLITFYVALVPLIILGYYSMFVTVLMTFALKYHGPIRPLIIFGAIFFPVTILVMVLMRCGAIQILRHSGIEIINGKVDLAKIPAAEDY